MSVSRSLFSLETTRRPARRGQERARGGGPRPPRRRPGRRAQRPRGPRLPAVLGRRGSLRRWRGGLTPRLPEQYGGDGRACQAAAADQHEGRARGGGVDNGAPEKVPGGGRDAHPAVDRKSVV